MSKFWRNWLSVWCGAVVLFGVLLIAAAYPSTEAIPRALLAIMNPAMDPVFTPTHRFAFGLMGAVSLGWGLTLWVAMRAAFALGAPSPEFWRGLTISMVVWYVIDSAISVQSGFALNAASNTLLLIGFLIPMFATGALGGRRAALA